MTGEIRFAEVKSDNGVKMTPEDVRGIIPSEYLHQNKTHHHRGYHVILRRRCEDTEHLDIIICQNYQSGQRVFDELDKPVNITCLLLFMSDEEISHETTVRSRIYVQIPEDSPKQARIVVLAAHKSKVHYLRFSHPAS